VEPADRELLIAYQCDGDESAFASLVSRHKRWIFAAARRRLGDDHLADDATQAVFVILAQKASHLIRSKRPSLAAWLFHTTHFTCARIRRARTRRELHERSADCRIDRDGRFDGALLHLMEDSIAELGAAQRELIVRRFYQQQEFAEIGVALKITAEAARKRLSRALHEVRGLMVRDGAEAIPDPLLDGLILPAVASEAAKKLDDRNRIDSIAKGTIAMVEQAKASEYPVVSAEFFVTDVDANLDLFEKLGFRRRWAEAPDAMGRTPRASLLGGVGRIWLRRAEESDGSRPSPGVRVYFWVDGGPEGLIAHRKRIAEAGMAVSPFFDDHSLRNFTVTTPDGYVIGFFTQYRDAAASTK